MPCKSTKVAPSQETGSSCHGSAHCSGVHLQVLCGFWLPVPVSAYWLLKHLFDMVSSPCRAFCCYTAPPFYCNIAHSHQTLQDELYSVQGQWIRVHPRPKRYPAASTTDWQSAVLYLDDDICVVNKPAGIPVQSHESNSAETVPRCLEQALGIKLWVGCSSCTSRQNAKMITLHNELDRLLTAERCMHCLL